MVRLSEMVNQVRRRMSEGQNFARNPAQMVWQSFRKYGMLAYGKLSVPFGNSQEAPAAKHPSSENDANQGSANQESAAQDFSNPGPANQRPADPGPVNQDFANQRPAIGVENVGNAAATSQRRQTAAANQETVDNRSWQPILQPRQSLQGGWWGVYTIKSCLYDQGWIRCYDGFQENGTDSVWIYEYCFDRDSWSMGEIDERKRRFKHLVDLNLRLGEGSDFRLVRPKDIIKPAENCVYLITRSIPHSVTLNDWLQQQPVPWTRPQIERFVNQVLQSLQYLQTYLVNWPGDRWEQQLSHGKLSGDCLWLRLPEGSAGLNGAANNQLPFFVYLGRFPLWEHLCWPQQTPIAQGNDDLGCMDDDLQALAHIIFSLVRGYQGDDNPADLSLWPDDNHIRALYPYVLQLLGHPGSDRFQSIDTAIAGLQQLPETYQLPQTPDDASTPVDESTEKTSAVLLALPLVLLGGGVLLSLLVWLVGVLRSEEPMLACPEICRLKDVDNAGLIPIRYGLEHGSSWEKAFFSRLTSPLMEPQPTEQFGGMTAMQEALQERDSDFKLEKAHNVQIPRALLLERLQMENNNEQELDVALMQNLPRLPRNLEKRVVAYDGIAIFVTHSNAQRQDSIPKRLDGRISWQQLRRILLDPDEPLDGAKVRIYWPEDDVTVNLLRDLLFKHDDEDRAAFDRRRNEERYAAKLAGGSQQLSQQANLYERMLQDFEVNAQIEGEDVIGIGFNRISQLIGQCSVYPLALVKQNHVHHLFINADGTPIDQTTDLCGDKGTYWVNDGIFPKLNDTPYPSAYGAKIYPLAYEMAVVYHRPDEMPPCGLYKEDCGKGQLLVDKLLTPEGQYLLSEVGLVPAKQSISDIRRMMWSPMAKGEQP